MIFCTKEKDDYDEYKKLHDAHDPRNSSIVNDDTSNDLPSSNSTEHFPVPSTSNTNESDSVSNLPRPEIHNLIEKRPVQLRNRENVCFFNSVVQVLFSLIPFRERILSDLVDNHVIRNMRQLFREKPLI